MARTGKDLKPINIWASSSGPNPWKPVIVFEELSLPYNLTDVPFSDLISDEFRELNPSGKVPVMHDPNTDVQIFESGAIILYLIEQYDTENKLTLTSVKEKALLYQWLMFQMSQQGPMYGQAAWFKHLHQEQLPSAIARYTKQVERILGVLQGALEGKDWLVGGKCTYADLSFFMWNAILPEVMHSAKGETPLSKYPNVLAWHERMLARASCKKVLQNRREKITAEYQTQDHVKDVDWKQLGRKLESSK